MESSVQVICSPAAAAGFRLAGLAPIEVGELSEAAARIRSALEQPGLGVLLVEEPMYEALGEADQRALNRRPLPIVVPFPGPQWTAREQGPEAFIAELLRQAIGYRVKLG